MLARGVRLAAAAANRWRLLVATCTTGMPCMRIQTRSCNLSVLCERAGSGWHVQRLHNDLPRLLDFKC